MICLKYNSHFN